MSRVLVAGGAGFVGRFIVEHLIEHGYDVIIGGRRPPDPGFFTVDLPFVPLLLDPDRDQTAAFDGIDRFVHAAFEHVEGKYRGGEGDDPEGFNRANVEGSIRLFEMARSAGVRRCVFLSSRAVYGSRLSGSIDETSPPDPDTLYGEVKVAAEDRLHALATAEFVTASLRVTGVYGAAGPGRRHKWAELFSTYLDGRPIQPRLGTEVHGDDVGAAVRLMLEADADTVSGADFNVSDLLLDTRQILALVQALTGCPHRLPEVASTEGYLVMSTDRLRALGWQPGGTARLKTTIRDLLADIGPV
ncbi:MULTISPECIES: NAD(P)-dependent oxidoreductase [unclassified Ensifer]|uniref:NAD-dependent epimerase/dehydratase family protein n=1 Tax=unclassified Ensifer TaxID=2633371 RepID=UPI000813AB1E|nr:MULTISPECIES: NAD(P)-dependent oxidoreductase [unclassified Ensifer]OCO97985.1 UDP-glucose 4-epimerase [Ensifer sp. LC11]OCO98628.1 UDP-glucose 4-epimerase [Ensifer sp. LC13]OCP04308.1 UDP-glucose 4-epimerase [Ensifer sp. LC14]OCP29300.1 UDP-glucose 4-epimerase [Ensifer sp. LC499]